MNSTWANTRAFSNLGFIESKLPDDMLSELSYSISNLTNTSEKYNQKLQGHIKEEYSLNHKKNLLSNFLLSLATNWAEANPGYIDSFEEVSKSKKYELYLDTMWVNKQQKYEFNPLHFHSGLLSFVIFVKIPYNLTDEADYFPLVSGTTEDNKENSYTSKFCFVYTDVLGAIKQLPVPVDKSFEGTILMFPSSLQHIVYPFYTSDDYRISVSGNIRIKVAE